MKTGVVDYKAGNLRSIQNLLQFLKADFIISDKAEELSSATSCCFLEWVRLPMPWAS